MTPNDKSLPPPPQAPQPPAPSPSSSKNSIEFRITVVEKNLNFIIKQLTEVQTAVEVVNERLNKLLERLERREMKATNGMAEDIELTHATQVPSVEEVDQSLANVLLSLAGDNTLDNFGIHSDPDIAFDHKLVDAVENRDNWDRIWASLKDNEFKDYKDHDKKTLGARWRKLVGQAKKIDTQTNQARKELLKKVLSLEKRKEMTEKGLERFEGPEVQSERQSSSKSKGTLLELLCQEPVNWTVGLRSKIVQDEFYIQVSEKELADNYPPPCYFQAPNKPIREVEISDKGNTDELPIRYLTMWSIYNIDLRMVPLELVPMRPCQEDALTIFAYGDLLTHKDDENDSNALRISMMSSPIREWKCTPLSIRTDFAWYNLTVQSEAYQPWSTALGNVRQNLENYIGAMLIKRGRVHQLERYAVSHGQLLLQLLAQLPDNDRRRASRFVLDLKNQMEEADHVKLLLQKEKVLPKREQHHNPITVLVAAKEDMQATSWLVSRVFERQPPGLSSLSKHGSVGDRIKKIGFDLYQRISPLKVVPGVCVFVKGKSDDELPVMYFVEYMHDKSDGRKLFHGRLMQRGQDTVLGAAANENELFLTNVCSDISLGYALKIVDVKFNSITWGYDKHLDSAEAEKKKEVLAIDFFCKSLYIPEKGAFFSFARESIGLGIFGSCQSCKKQENKVFKVSSSKRSFVDQEPKYSINDFVYVSPHHFVEGRKVDGGSNVGLKAYVVCQVLEIVSENDNQPEIECTWAKLRRFYRPEDVSYQNAYRSDVREVYYSEETARLRVDSIEGRCEVRKKSEGPFVCDDHASLFEHIFFCQSVYDPSERTIKALPAHIIQSFTTRHTASPSSKGKRKHGEEDAEIHKPSETSRQRCLTTMDIFAGCGGLSEGLQQSGASKTHWVIEDDEQARVAFISNHSKAIMSVNNSNVILRALMQKYVDANECITASGATGLATSLDEQLIRNFPKPGQVDFIIGGSPCQGYSGINGFNQSTWSKIQREAILAILSFVDYFHPKYFLLQNMREIVSFDEGQMFRLTLASLLEMGYQVRFGLLEAGAFGVSQSQERAFIWAASPDEVLPEWPEPMHVFPGPELKIKLSENSHYTAVRRTENGAPFRAVTVKDSIFDLPHVQNGDPEITLNYGNGALSWYQKKLRRNKVFLTDHMSIELNKLNLIRCQYIPKQAGADWNDLPDEKVSLPNGEANLIPWWLPNTVPQNEWKGLFGRLDWEGNFPTLITEPQPMGKVGMCLHPDQNRILTVRECARSQGFSDSYQFSGTMVDKYRQIGNAVPPPLAYALGRMLKEAISKTDVPKPPTVRTFVRTERRTERTSILRC